MLMASLLAGCGADVGNKQAVTGQVKLKGQPLGHGMIQFTPKLGSAGTMSGADIKDGRYEIPREMGLDPGEYDVRVTSPAAPAATVTDLPGESGPVAEDLIPPAYNSNTTLVYTVKAGQANEFNVDIP